LDMWYLSQGSQLIRVKLMLLRSFLFLLTLYRYDLMLAWCHTIDISSLDSPLFALTKKDSVFEWSPSCQQAFEKLKQLLITSPILVFPDFTKRLIIETDVSGVGLGTVLSQ